MKVVAALFLFITLVGCSDDQPEQNIATDTSQVSVVTGVQPGTGLLRIADSEHYFQQHNVSVDIEEKLSGKLAIISVINKEVDADIIFTADIAYLANQHSLPDYRVVASVFDSDNLNAIASIKPLGDIQAMAGKTLCTQYLSALHFFGQVLVERNAIQDVTYQFYKVSELNDRLLDGECDFITTREPLIADLLVKSDHQAQLTFFPGVYLQHELMLAHDRVADETLSQFVKSMIQAESLFHIAPEQVNLTLSQSLKTTPKQLSILHNDSVWEVSLYQPLIPLLERQMEWLISHGVDEGKGKSFSSSTSLRPDVLQHIAPLRQTVIAYED
ncbi:hypothetical protein BIZ37_20355 [Photobacterium sp. BZF1]|uniref:ABC transporter substrate-binding protein n=1 Tax=Photobacterium sp. BZF1 TaxID=1904457 RepID=UPI001653C694|nr:hypothetical protein [Photobacterium sp. BZF1]MBC7004920.1 hypothetical protein [Photobacterium sp. BZF1]